MEELNKILTIIDKKITKLESQQNKISGLVDSEIEDVSSSLLKIENLLMDFNCLKNLEENDFINIANFCSKEDIQYLKVYKEVAKNNNFSFSSISQEKLKIIYNTIKTSFNIYKQKLLNNSEILIEIKKELEILYKISKNINSEYDVFTFEKILDLIKESDLIEDEKIDLLIYMANSSIASFDIDVLNINLEEETEERLEETNLSDKELLDLFKLFGYDFDLFKPKAKTKLKKYGKLNNIKDILNELKYQKIDLSEIIINKSSNIVEIFIYSNAKLIKEILNIAESKNINFYQLIKIPSCFISKKKNFLKIGYEHSHSENSGVPIGSYEDFQRNIQLIEEIFSKVYDPKDFNALFDKCSFIFIKPHNNIKKAIKIFDYYGISLKEYLKTLSSLNSYHIYEIIDLCIELGCFDYLKENLSKVNLMPDDEQFYMIARARQLGYSDYKLFNSRGLRYKELKEDKHIGIDKTNGAIVTNKYVLNEPLSTIFNRYNDILLESSKLEDFNFSIINYYLKVSQTNLKFKDFDRLYFNLDNPLIYNINGIVISRNKVLRIYNNLLARNIDDTIELLLFALTYNSIITQEQFNNIYAEIGKIYSSKEKKI